MDGEYITEYDMLINAAKLTGINSSCINECCYGFARQAKGYRFIFEKDYVCLKDKNGNVDPEYFLDRIKFRKAVNEYQKTDGE